MTYNPARRLAEAGTVLLAALGFLIIPYIAAVHLPDAAIVAVAALGIVALYVLRERGAAALDRTVHGAFFRRPETRTVVEFTGRVGVSFTMADLVDAVHDALDGKAGFRAVLLDSDSGEPLYRGESPGGSGEADIKAIASGFKDLPEGFFHAGADLKSLPRPRGSRGLLMKCKGLCLFIGSERCHLIEPEAIHDLFGELQIFHDRVDVISDLFKTASRSREWKMIAETQRSFLPKALPRLAQLDCAVAYRPLINVSGDYYDAIRIDDTKLLLVAGDVSGKGLAAALVMGIILNTIRVAADKTDLGAVVQGVDRAIREMGFDDKFTIIFLGLVDLSDMSLRYVNAALADCFVISQSAIGPRLAKLEPTMGLVGLVPLSGVDVAQIPIRSDDFLVLMSDGVTESVNAAGVRLGDVAQFKRTLLQASRAGGAEDYISTVSGLLYSFVGDVPLKDDVTILAAKVGKLWD